MFGRKKNYETVKKVVLDNFEWRVLIGTLDSYRQKLKAQGKDTTDINNILLRVIDAPAR